MRATKSGKYLKLRAIAGTHVVVLAWDFAKAPGPTSFTGDRNLLGFAVHRTKLGDAGEVLTQYYLRGIKRFKDKDKGLPPGAPVPTDEHPVQTLQWGDYTAEAGCLYVYKVAPVYGAPKNLHVADNEAVTVKVRCEPAVAPEGQGARHDVHFNRGVIGSQAYAREFPGVEPDVAAPASKPMQWLSRGLYEALLAFVKQGARKGMGLRCAFYEFHYDPVAQALAKAAAQGDVEIVYDGASSYKTDNLKCIKKAKLQSVAHARTVSAGIRHNKFIVLLDHGTPVGVWTGSTNISAGGIFGHSNVGHVVHDPGIAAKYLAYYERLKQNLTPTKMREPNALATPLPKLPLKRGVSAIFSPRETKEAPQAQKTLQWYADLAAGAQELVCFTAAFDIAKEFLDVFRAENDVLRYVVKDDPLKAAEDISVDGDVVFAAGGHLDGGVLENFLAERDNPLNSNDYIHTKYMLVDPLGPTPTVVTGSANFSAASQHSNDENMLVIRGNKRVADIYFGEFMRLFDHHYARYLARKYGKPKTTGKASAGGGGGYLKEETAEWLPAHFDDASYKSKRRRYFAGS